MTPKPTGLDILKPESMGKCSKGEHFAFDIDEAAAALLAEFLRIIGEDELETNPPRTTPGQIDNYGRQIRNNHRAELRATAREFFGVKE